jgi:hypothetical protein
MAEYYRYTPCPGSTATEFYTEVPPVSISGTIVFVSGDADLPLGECFSISLADLVSPPINLFNIFWPQMTYEIYNNCTECESKGDTVYQLTNCEDESTIVYTTTDLSLLIGSVITVDEYPDDCWTVDIVGLRPTTLVPVTPELTYSTCEECLRQYYLLEDCDLYSPQLNIITSQDLSQYVGQVIILDSCPDTCWRVSETDVRLNNQIIHILSSFSTCEICTDSLPCICTTVSNHSTVAETYEYLDCDGDVQTFVLQPETKSDKICVKKWYNNNPLTDFYATYGDCVNNLCPTISTPKKTITPGVNTPGCSFEKYIRFTCNFADAVYNDVLAKAYGINPCCAEDLDKAEIKKELLNYAAAYNNDYPCTESTCKPCGC